MTRQIPLDEWPLGLEVEALQLTLAPGEIARRTGVTFTRDHDSLDDFDAAVIDLGKGRSFGLQHHLNAPHPGIVVLLDGSDKDVRDVVRFLKLEPQEIAWTAPQLAPAVERAFSGREAGSPTRNLVLLAAGLTATAIVAFGSGILDRLGLRLSK
jgi:hypothetical protein